MSDALNCRGGCAPVYAQRACEAEPVRVPCGCDGAQKQSCFTPLTTTACMAAAQALGIDPGKVLDVSFEFGPPGHAFVVARYLLDDAAMSRVLEALAAIPKAGKQ